MTTANSRLHRKKTDSLL